MNNILLQVKAQKRNMPNYKSKITNKDNFGNSFSEDDWHLHTLEELTIKVGSGVTPKGGSDVYIQSGIPLIRSQNVLAGKIDLSNVVFISSLQHNKMSNSSVQPNDVLLNITGASIGRSAVVPSNFKEANVNQHVCIIRCAKMLDSIFLSLFLNSSLGQKQIDSFQAGGNREGLNYEQIKSFIIQVPSLKKQKKIATILTTWDTAIDKLEKLIVSKEKLKNGLMQQLLTGKKRFKEFKKEKWTTLKIKDVFKYVPTYSYSRDNLIYDENMGSCLYIHYGDIHTKYKNALLDPNKNRTIPFLKKEIHLKTNLELLKDGDLIISDASEDYDGVGECLELINVKGNKIVGGLHTIALRDNSMVTQNKFRPYIIKHPSVKKQLKQISTGSSVYSISKSSLSDVTVFLPSKSEQGKIALILEKIDVEIFNLQNTLQKFKVQKLSLMNQLLKGQKKIKSN